jgi:hypothetical protein
VSCFSASASSRSISVTPMIALSAQLVAHVGEELRLVLARLSKLLALVLDFIEQTHVLDCDHRLVGENLEQLGLPPGEGSGLFAEDGDDADGLPLAQRG